MASCLPGKEVVRGVAVIETVRQQQNGSCPSSAAGSRCGRTVHLVSNDIISTCTYMYSEASHTQMLHYLPYTFS